MTAEPLPNFRCKRDLHVPEASAKIFFGVGSRPHKARCYKTIKGISWNFKFCWFFFMLRVPPATLQLSRQNSSRGGDPGSCSRIDSFLLHPLEPPLPLEAVWGHFPIWKITAGDQPLDLLEDLRGEMGFFLAIKIFKQKLCWQKCMGLLALPAFRYILNDASLVYPNRSTNWEFPCFFFWWLGMVFSEITTYSMCLLLLLLMFP